MTVQAPGLLFRWIDCFATARVGLARLIYGDQGLFVRRDLFVRLGGFPAVPFMEDVLFSRRLRRNGRLVVAARRIYVSPRRWQREGILRQTARNWALLTLEGLGVPVDWLAVHYPAVR
jgi:GT2 family glycosyltransferase